MEINEKLKKLIENFEPLTKEEVELLVDHTIVKEYKKGTIILREGQIPKNCYMVVEGCVREYLIKDGEDISTEFYLNGATFTPHLSPGTPSSYYWECLEDCVLTVSNKNFEEEIRKLIPRLDSVFQEIAIKKINHAKREWSQFISSSPEERYLYILEKRPELMNKVSLRHLASYLGMKPQSLSRIRNRISKKQN